MPLFLYICPTCKAEVEHNRNAHSRDEITKCPNCLATMKRAVTAAAFNVQGFNAGNRYGLEGK